ncbi:MAG: ScpA family protein [Archaeoglobaceae archaeon]|nr:segregation/condensation protein A [Archaeoglobaceae archaeon]MDW7989599.1 ScpA family protein [Archaeoglobaceae archaeon]
MAKKGEIDPWNIDVIDVTDKFLKKIEEVRKLDLRISGRVLLYAAILIRMKADAIAPQPSLDESDVEIIKDTDFWDVDEGEIEDLFRVQKRRVRKISTLKDLIKELKKAEAIEKKRKKRREVDMGFVTSIPHDESIEERVAEIAEMLRKILQKKDFVTLFSLVDTKERLVDLYISLLYLVQKGQFQVYQKDFYGDIEIRMYGK